MSKYLDHKQSINVDLHCRQQIVARDNTRDNNIANTTDSR